MLWSNSRRQSLRDIAPLRSIYLCLPPLNRRSFSEDLKLQAVRLVRDQHIPAIQVCKDFNISRSTLHRWLLQYDAERSGATGTGTPITAEQRRIRELERENRQLRQDVDILKKASAFFARGLA